MTKKRDSGVKIGDYDIPFDRNGNQMHYAEVLWPDVANRRDGISFKPNAVFTDVLTFVGFERGRSAAYAKFTRSNQREVVVFLRDLEDMLPLMRDGKVGGEFAFCKRGQNYGCKAVAL